MQNPKNLIRLSFNGILAALAVFLLGGCIAEEHPEHYEMTPQPPGAAQVAPTNQPVPTAQLSAVPPPAAAPAPATLAAPIRIKAGLTTPLTDADGNVWLPDQDLNGGDMVERPDLQIANTKTPDLYRSEHYSMTNFSRTLPNGKYTVKLHFCETYEGITGPGQRVFTFDVMGHEFKDFDIWVKAPGFLRAYIETVPVEVTAGRLDITFTAQVENPQICGIEIIPSP